MKAFPRLRRPRGAVTAAVADEPRGEPRPQVIETATMRWINIDAPRLADRQWLAESFSFHELDLEDVASHNQRPKVDEYDDYLFLIMQFPRIDRDTARLHAAELDIFLGPDYVRSEEHTSELQSPCNLVCRLLLEKK